MIYENELNARTLTRKNISYIARIIVKILNSSEYVKQRCEQKKNWKIKLDKTV